MSNSGPFIVKCTYELKPRIVKTKLTAIDAARVIHGLAGEPDVTIAISRKGAADEMLVHITGFSAFLRLIRDGQPYTYLEQHGGRGGTVPFWIEGHETDIPSRNVIDVDTAASAVREWLEREDEPSPDVWGRY
jgi:hypothetical protein